MQLKHSLVSFIVTNLIMCVRFFPVIEKVYPKTEPKFSVIKNPKTEPSVFISVRLFRLFGYGSVISVFLLTPTSKTGPRDYYKGKNCKSTGFHTRKGDYVVVQEKLPNYVVPDLTDFKVYICGISSQEEVPDDPEQIEPNPDSIRVLKRVVGTVSSHLGEESRVKAE
ncbi:putative ribosomal protein L27/L41 [Helianthus anomalus]